MIEITLCVNNNCPLRTRCGRHRMNINDNSVNDWTSYAYFENEDENNCKVFFDSSKNQSDYEKLKNISC